MKIEIESREDHAQAYCDMCLSKAIRNGTEPPCGIVNEDDGSDTLTLTVHVGKEKRMYELSPEEQGTIYEASRELPAFEVNVA